MEGLNNLEFISSVPDSRNMTHSSELLKPVDEC